MYIDCLDFEVVKFKSEVRFLLKTRMVVIRRGDKGSDFSRSRYKKRNFILFDISRTKVIDGLLRGFSRFLMEGGREGAGCQNWRKIRHACRFLGFCGRRIRRGYFQEFFFKHQMRVDEDRKWKNWQKKSFIAEESLQGCFFLLRIANYVKFSRKKKDGAGKA